MKLVALCAIHYHEHTTSPIRSAIAFVYVFLCLNTSCRLPVPAVSERIMKFAQCPTDVSQLEMVRQCRDQRAKLRAEGLRLTRALVAAAASPPAKV